MADVSVNSLKNDFSQIFFDLASYFGKQGGRVVTYLSPYMQNRIIAYAALISVDIVAVKVAYKLAVYVSDKIQNITDDKDSYNHLPAYIAKITLFAIFSAVVSSANYIFVKTFQPNIPIYQVIIISSITYGRQIAQYEDGEDNSDESEVPTIHPEIEKKLVETGEKVVREISNLVS